MNIERAKIAIDKMVSFLPEDILNDLYKDQNATSEIVAKDEKRIVFSIVYHDNKDKRILSITVKLNEIDVHYNGTMQVFSHRIDESFYNDVLNVLFDAEDPLKPESFIVINQSEITSKQSGNTNMKTRTIEVNVYFVIAALESRYDDVKELWGCQASHDLWEQALSLVEYAGLGNCSSPSAYVDNYLVNGEFVNRKDLSDCESRSITITCCDDEGDFISDEDWDQFCQDNALIYNDEYACLQF